MDQSYIILLAILGLSLVGHNMSVAYATGAILVIKLLGLTQVLDLLGKHGLNWGIILLTVAILVPIANGSIGYKEIVECFKGRVGLISLVIGIFVALAGFNGVNFLKEAPEIVSSLIIGTMIGVFFFNGVPVGPLIAAGVTYWILSALKYLHL